MVGFLVGLIMFMMLRYRIQPEGLEPWNSSVVKLWWMGVFGRLVDFWWLCCCVYTATCGHSFKGPWPRWSAELLTPEVCLCRRCSIFHFAVLRENSGWLMGMTVFNLLGGECNGLNLLIFIYLGAFACPSFKLKLTACCQSRDIWQGPSPKLSIFNLPDVGCSDCQQCMRSWALSPMIEWNVTLEGSVCGDFCSVRSMFYVHWLLSKAMTEQICRDLLSQFGKLRHTSASTSAFVVNVLGGNISII